MRSHIQDNLLILNAEDLPSFKKGGSTVRNSYFWAMKAIAGHAPRSGDWEYEPEVWLALKRILLSFQLSGYLGLSETQLEFPAHHEAIPEVLRAVSTWQ